MTAFDAVVDRSPQASYSKGLQGFVFALFFAFGGITSLNDVVIPKLKELFTLSYSEATLVQSAFFAAYFIFSIPAAALVRRIGYMRSAVMGLLVIAAGCLLFIPASAQSLYGLFLFALFVVGSGIATVQVVANPLISLLGPVATTSSRLTFAQAFNSLGTTLFPYVGAILILGSLSKIDAASLTGAALAQFRSAETHVVVSTYLGLAISLVVLAGLVFSQRKSLIEGPADTTPILRAFALLGRPRFGFGAFCIFLYVGGEVAIGSMMVSYLMDQGTLGLAAAEAGKHVPYYWGGAMVGRFVGAYVLRVIAPWKVLAGAAAAAIVLLALSANSAGSIAGWSLIAIGFFNSIMFPTIFSLASEGLGKRAAEGSGVICMAIVGGAVVPKLWGIAADAWGLRLALVVPAACYLGIVLFSWFARRPAVELGSTIVGIG